MSEFTSNYPVNGGNLRQMGFSRVFRVFLVTAFRRQSPKHGALSSVKADKWLESVLRPTSTRHAMVA